MEPILEEFKNSHKVEDAQLHIWKEELNRELDVHSNFSLERV